MNGYAVMSIVTPLTESRETIISLASAVLNERAVSEKCRRISLNCPDDSALQSKVIILTALNSTRFNFQIKELKMADSRFWRTLAVLFVAGVFYLAHGLHDPASVGSIPSLTQKLHAGDVATATSGNSTAVKIITSSDDGKVINVWSTNTSSSSGVTFGGSFAAEKK